MINILRLRANLKKNLNILVRSLYVERRNFFSYKFSVLKLALTAPKYTRMHHFETIFRKFPSASDLILQQFSIVLQRKISWTPLSWCEKFCQVPLYNVLNFSFMLSILKASALWLICIITWQRCDEFCGFAGIRCYKDQFHLCWRRD